MKRRASRFSGGSRWIATALALLLVMWIQPSLNAQYPNAQYPPEQMPPQGDYVPMDVPQLNQLVAPIALYPDSLVAQILTAATYSQEVTEASNWMHQYGAMPPEQVANSVNGMPWDPSVKALTEFPSVLDNMARNISWTGALGDAYYNQPGDVMNAVQAMRIEAQQAGTLRSTPQTRVYDNGGLVVIEPTNPTYVYVPYYDPWRVYGPMIDPWTGYYILPPPRGVVIAEGIGIGFGMAISVGVYSHYGWGYHAWSPNWRGGVVVYNRTTYISRSPRVIHYGDFGARNRWVYEHEGRGVPRGFHPPVTNSSAQFHPDRGGNYNNRPANAPGNYNRRGEAPGAPAYRQNNGGNYGRPAGNPPHTYQRPPAQPAPANTYQRPPAQPAPPNTYQRPPAQQAPSNTYQRPPAQQAPPENRPQGLHNNNGRQPAAPEARPATPPAAPAQTPSRPAEGYRGGGGREHPQAEHPQDRGRGERKNEERK